MSEKKYFLVTKHQQNKKKKGKRARHFFGPEEFERQRELARKYGAREGVDFLIVEVVEEIENTKQEDVKDG